MSSLYPVNVAKYLSMAIAMMPELMFNVDIFMADKLLKMLLGQQAEALKKLKNSDKDYLTYMRLNADTDLPMDKYDKATIDGLVNLGDQLWKNNTDSIKAMLEQVVDEKFGYLLSK